MKVFSAVSLLLFTAYHVSGGEHHVYPSEVNITGPNRIQQLLVVEEENGRVVKDQAATSNFTTSNEKIATVSKTGRVTAVGNGEAIISATVNNTKVTSSVTVSGFDKPAEWSFRNHVVPTMTRLGCNSGACHGALAGKGGFKLSLRGFDPDTDWFVMTRQAQARRVDLSKPAESLLLKKTTRTLPHGGGKRIVEGDDH